MGPRQKCLGNCHSGGKWGTMNDASMGPRQKCLGNYMAWLIVQSTTSCFNGAETKMSRKLDIVSENYSDTVPLQWGRDKNVSEIVRTIVWVDRTVVLLQWGRDKNVSEIRQSRQSQQQDQNASMGPRQKCLGNLYWLTKISVIWRLQWGRDKNVSEIMTPQQKIDFLVTLQWGRDKNVSEMHWRQADIILRRMLQWGRDKNVSEIATLRFLTDLCTGLQWGRDKNVSEMILSFSSFAIHGCASMGPRQKCLGNESIAY